MYFNKYKSFFSRMPGLKVLIAKPDVRLNPEPVQST
jgi:hypothetical protein